MIPAYKGVEITLDENCYFAFDLDGNACLFPSYREAKERIDERIKQREKEEVAKLSIPAISEDLIETTVTGVHAGNGEILMRPSLRSSRYDSPARVYYRCKKSVELLSRVSELRESLNSVCEELASFRIAWKDTEKWESFERSKHAEYVRRLKDLAGRLEKEHGDKA